MTVLTNFFFVLFVNYPRLKSRVVHSVIYIVGSPEECKLEKVSFSYTQEGGEPEVVEQYRIHATSNAAAAVTEVDPQAGEEAAGEATPAETEAPTDDEAQEAAPDATDYSHRTEVREVLCAGSNGLLALPMAPQPRPMAGCHGTRPFQRLPWKTAYGV